MCYYGIRKRKEIKKMKLFCILVILVFVIVLGVYYSVMFACAYKKFDEKMKKSQKKS